MTDAIVEAIQTGALHAGNISFDRLRNIAGRDHGPECWQELGRGRAILGSQEHLDQYLYTYGKMTKSQWGEFLTGVAIPDGAIRLIDYGCGQGLACALLFDKFGPQLIKRIEEVVLVEPSSPALARAKSILACYCADANVLDLNKKLDELTSEDLRQTGETNTVHVFSNVLDIDDFDYVSLFERMFQIKGRHSVLAVSHDRDFHGGSARFGNISRLVDDPQCRDVLAIGASEIKQFRCYDGKPAISWQLHLEVLNGPF